MSNEWKMMRLGDVLKRQPKSTIKAGNGDNIGVYKFFTSSSEQTKYIDISTYTQKAIILGTGGNANIHYCKEPFSTSTDCFVYFAQGDVCVETIYRYLSGNIHILQSGFKGAGLKHISKNYIEDIMLPLPSIERQREIAAVLDKASELVSKRKAQLDELDRLAESIFYDMFGDPVTNEKGWDVSPIKDIATVKIGPFGSLLHVEDYISGGVPLVNPVHMKNLRVIADENLTVSTEKYNELSSYILNPNDIIFGRRGDIGRCALITGNENGYICGTGSLFVRFRVLVEPQYSICALSHSSIVKYLIDRAKGATMLNINCKIVENMPIILPPLSLQQQFTERIEKIEEQKTKVKAALKESEELFQRLMQDMFNPENKNS